MSRVGRLGVPDGDRSRILHVRVSEAEHRAFASHAKRSGLTLAAWTRLFLGLAAGLRASRFDPKPLRPKP
jgi:hypothetical protein